MNINEFSIGVRIPYIWLNDLEIIELLLSKNTSLLNIQNINQMLSEVGERYVTILLYEFLKKNKQNNWIVYKNLETNGCDIVLRNKTKDKCFYIEVKTRQKLSSDKKLVLLN